MSASPIATQPDVPAFVVPPENLVPVSDYPAHMAEIPPSRMFLIREALGTYKARFGKDAITYDASQGDGGASLPGVPAEILQRALALQLEHGSAYDQPFGTAQFRKASAELYWKLDPTTGWGENNIIFTQGGRDGLQKAYSAMMHLGAKESGSVMVVSRVPWISYNWGPYALGLNVMLAPGRPEQAWAYTPEAIRACVATALESGRKIAGIVITSPDNPTGRIATLEEQAELAHAALDAGIPYVLLDWMYHWITENGPYDLNAFLRMFTPDEREHLIVIDGLTKSVGASNIRAAQLLAGKQVIRFITSQASHSVIPSFFAQAVAIAAYEMGFENAARTIIEPTNRSRTVLQKALTDAGLEFISGGGYYAFINCGEHIRAGGLPDSEGLLKYLGAEYGIAVVPGVYFSEAAADWIRFSYALDPELTAGACKRLVDGLNALKT
ncbi:MAG TPA: pyridoxal phosphate-dependent aminotransferase [Candidatus Limnocylindrales bacterium]|nr:pyridoxal phosphate-dependent aminotransferase [Candidatus Limnocylindrales bacterium]